VHPRANFRISRNFRSRFSRLRIYLRSEFPVFPVFPAVVFDAPTRDDPFSGHLIGRGFRSFRNFRKRHANRHRVGIPAQCGATAAGMIDRGVANMIS
jgi:hypothetical protein